LIDANNVDLSQLDRWYSQSGTPRVKVEQQYDAATKTLRLIVSQRTPTTPGANQREEEKKPFLIPLLTGLLDSSTGKEIVPSTLLVLKEAKQEFTFENVPTKPILSILRDFSAPVILELEQSDDELFSLIAHDTDAFNKWDAVNRYFIKILNQGIHEFEKQGDSPSLEFPSGIVSPAFLNSLRTLLLSAKNDPSKDKSLIAYALQLPDENTLMNLMPEGQAVPVQGLYYARKLLKQLIAKTLEKEIMETYLYCKSQDSGIYLFTPAEVGRRRLQTVCLDYIASLYDAPATTSEMKMMIRQLLKKRFDESSSMTDKLSAIIPLTSIPSIEKDEALQQFYVDAHQHPLVINKWFAIQANADYSTLLDDIKKLKTHADFFMTNPNRARSLLTTFSNNFYHFHQSSGKGYEFIANAIIEVDPINPQVASRLMSCFSSWKKFDANRKELMHQALIRIQNTPNLSSDTYEIVSRYLK
jgi:aminopeptidase N